MWSYGFEFAQRVLSLLVICGGKFGFVGGTHSQCVVSEDRMQEGVDWLCLDNLSPSLLFLFCENFKGEKN